MRGQDSHVAARAFWGLSLVLSIVFASVYLHSAASPPSAKEATKAARDVSAVAGAGTPSVMVDNVVINVDAPWIDQPFTAPPVDGIQVATAMQPHPYRELSITSMPYGYPPATEALPVPSPGSVNTLRTSLISDRQHQGAIPIGSPTATIFGQQILGAAYEVTSHFSSMAQQAVVVSEWLAEAGGRVWLARATAEISGGFSSTDVLAEIQQVAMSSANLTTTTALAAPPDVVQASANAVPTPPWWSGACDDTNYYAGSQKLGWPVHSYQLAPGAVFSGMVACGPRPFYNEGPDVQVQFFSGAVRENEFECVELSTRWLYQQYGIAPYVANGSQIVWNYNGTTLQKVANSTSGQAPAAGDVLSYGSTSTAGHTSVVTGAQVNSSGNGSVTVIEENASSSGTENLTVSGWTIQASPAVSGWLHDPNANPAPPQLTAASPASNIVIGQPYRYTFQASGSPSPTFAVQSGQLPSGLSLNATSGVLSGTPNVTGAFTFTVSASNGVGSPAVTGSLAMAAAWGPSDYPAVALQNGGVTEVVVERVDHSLWEYYNFNGSLTWNPDQIAGSGSAYSASAMALQNGNVTEVAVEGPSNSLEEYYNLNGSLAWNPDEIAGSGSTFSAPAIVVQNGGCPGSPCGVTQVVVQGAGNSLQEYYNFNGSLTWNPDQIAGSGSAYSAPAMALQNGNVTEVAVEGPSNGLEEYYNLNGSLTWNPDQIAGSGSTFSAPAIVVQNGGCPGSPCGVTQVVAQGGSNSFQEYYNFNGSLTWNPDQVAGPGSCYSTPAMTLQAGNVTEVVTEAASNGLYEYFNFNGSLSWSPDQIG
ncbi:MAG TPA: putative Ig domain-containing protein [Candidatus Angelobacter sp.]|jgi:hypothetical protein|nr:putative Ig domain-containing protein [Candidatus Angelobacter sp.]